MLDALFEARWGRVAAALAFTGFVVSPGVLFFAVFEPSLFAATDLGKVVLLAVAATLPLLTMNGVILFRAIAHAAGPWKNSAEVERFVVKMMSAAAAMNVVPMYAPILFRLLFHLGGLRTAMILAALVAAGQGFVVGVLVWWHSPCSEEEKRFGAELRAREGQ